MRDWIARNRVGDRLPSWRQVVLALYIGVNLALLWILRPFSYPTDWHLWRWLPEGLASGQLYTPNIPYVWSPLTAPVMGLIGLTGFWPQAVAQIGLVLCLKQRWLIVALLSSVTFWPGVFGGNPLFALAFVSGVRALDGSRPWSLTYLVLAFMIPRPLFFPLAGWLVLRDRPVRKWAAVAFVSHAALVMISGYPLQWAEIALRYAGSPGFDLGPTAVIGRTWLLIGIPLGFVLFARGWVGIAGLAVSPYILHGYLLWPLLDFKRIIAASKHQGITKRGSPPNSQTRHIGRRMFGVHGRRPT